MYLSINLQDIPSAFKSGLFFHKWQYWTFKLTVGMNRFLSQNVSLSTRMFHSTKNIVKNKILLAFCCSLLLLLSRFSRVRLCATPERAAHQAPPSLGFSRQEHWSRLPFPSPMHESEKWKWSRSVVSDPQRPHELQPTGLLHPWDFPGKSTGVGCHTSWETWG